VDPLIEPEILEWTQSVQGDVDYLDYLSQHAGLADWVALARVFSPQFVEVRGCIIWDRSYDPENFSQWFQQLGSNTEAVEATLNQFRLWQYVDIADDEPSQNAAHELSQIIANSWRNSLERAFPHIRFTVSAYETEDGPTVGFTQSPT
jgi:hypothetical protein